MNVGRSKVDITIFVEGLGMLGYGMYFNTAKSVASRLYCRSFAFKNKQEELVVIAVCELGFITDSIKEAILEKVTHFDVNNSNLLLLAQHTHSGPGGYSHYALYNFTTPGFVPKIFHHLVNTISQAIIASIADLQAGEISIGKATFDERDEVAFNRSLDAYNRNTDVEPLTYENRHLAVDRTMTLLEIKDKNSTSLGSINWFGVHPTSISNDNHAISSDNKGYAASYLEEYMNPAFVGAFAQGACGDISPKFIYNPKRKTQRGQYEGKYPDDFESAKYNGNLQFKKAKEILEQPQRLVLKSEQIKSHLQYFDFSNITVDPELVGGRLAIRTSPSCLGMAFLGGSKTDGPGAPRVVEVIGKKLARRIKRWELNANKDSDEKLRNQQKYAAQGPKDIIIESGVGKILGTSDIKNVILPGIFDGGIRSMKKQHRDGALITTAWTPQILPIQWIQIGEVLLAAFPFEISTVASYRLHKFLLTIIDQSLIKEVILCPYANSYNGYITTFEEYQEQMYEGGHTVFGEHSLAALETCFNKIAENINNNKIDTSVKPLTFSSDEINKRTNRSRFAD